MAKPEGLPPDSLMLQTFSGIKNTVGAERLGPTELQVAQNVDIDDAFQTRRRRGMTQVINADVHSIFMSGGTLYGVIDGDLSIIRPDWSHEVIRADVGPDAIAYVAVGEEIYFASRSVSGMISNGAVSDWGATVSEGEWISPVINPTSDLGAIRGKLLGAPPMATSLAYYNGRIYLANDRTLWATELYMYSYVDKTRNFFYFEAPITGVGAVTDGLYVGTETAVYFLSGAFTEMRRVQVAVDGMLHGSIVRINPEAVGAKETISRSAILFMTNGGLFAGLDNGLLLDLTGKNVWFPKSEHVAALFREQDGVNQYVGVTDSGGSPASTARIGDYVDAEIRRFQGA